MKEINARTIIEIMGSPEDHVNNTMNLVIKKLEERPGIKILKKELFKAKKIKDQPLWSTFVEFEITVKTIDTLIGFCFDFLPSSVEILNEEDIGFKNDDVTDFVNDLLGRLHQYDMALKNIYAQNMILKEEMEKLKGNKEIKKAKK